MTGVKQLFTDLLWTRRVANGVAILEVIDEAAAKNIGENAPAIKAKAG